MFDFLAVNPSNGSIFRRILSANDYDFGNSLKKIYKIHRNFVSLRRII